MKTKAEMEEYLGTTGKSKETVSITIDKKNRNRLREMAINLRWSYDSLIDDMIKVYQTKKCSEDMRC